jgi:hypothetical protein
MEGGEVMGRESISSRSLVWISGFCDRKWRHHERAIETESEPARRNVEHWSRRSTSGRHVAGSLDKFALTADVALVY